MAHRRSVLIVAALLVALAAIPAEAAKRKKPAKFNPRGSSRAEGRRL
jgi:hypothetical protein